MIDLRKKLPYWNRLIIVLAAFFVVTGALQIYRHKKLATPPLTPHTELTYTAPSNDNKATQDAKENFALPSSLLIKVPFTPQAPTANWDPEHEEACEEASAIMANAYFSKIDSLPADKVEQEITKLTNWEDKNQGAHLDQTSEEVAKMIESVYGLHTEIVALDSVKIMQKLQANKLVLVSFNGQLLNNPHYKQPGPIHHMMVITGWTDDGHFITNDPGTKFGENYQYDYPTLEEAAADWDHQINTVNPNKKFAIVVSN